MLVTRLGSPSLAFGSGEADRADDKTEPALLVGEDVLDGDPHPRSAGVAAARCGGIGLPRGFGRHQPAPHQQCDVGDRAVGAVAPNGASGVVRIEQPAELAAIMARGIGHREAADEAVPAVDAV
jgi:hypothetical protein